MIFTTIVIPIITFMSMMTVIVEIMLLIYAIVKMMRYDDGDKLIPMMRVITITIKTIKH